MPEVSFKERRQSHNTVTAQWWREFNASDAPNGIKYMLFTEEYILLFSQLSILYGTLQQLAIILDIKINLQHRTIH